MSTALNEMFAEGSVIIQEELHKAKKLRGTKLDKFKQYYGISTLDGDLFYTNRNLIITSKYDYALIRNLILPENHVLIYDIAEYGLHISVMRYMNDANLNEVFQ
jgi:hypothetical protein